MTDPVEPVVTCCADGGLRLVWLYGWKWAIETDENDTRLRYCPWCGANLPKMEQAQEGVADGC